MQFPPEFRLSARTINWLILILIHYSQDFSLSQKQSLQPVYDALLSFSTKLLCARWSHLSRLPDLLQRASKAHVMSTTEANAVAGLLAAYTFSLWKQQLPWQQERHNMDRLGHKQIVQQRIYYIIKDEWSLASIHQLLEVRHVWHIRELVLFIDFT